MNEAITGNINGTKVLNATGYIYPLTVEYTKIIIIKTTQITHPINAPFNQVFIFI